MTAVRSLHIPAFDSAGQIVPGAEMHAYRTVMYCQPATTATSVSSLRQLVTPAAALFPSSAPSAAPASTLAAAAAPPASAKQQPALADDAHDTAPPGGLSTSVASSASAPAGAKACSTLACNYKNSPCCMSTLVSTFCASLFLRTQNVQAPDTARPQLKLRHMHVSLGAHIYARP
jgi:hypothetical protein